MAQLTVGCWNLLEGGLGPDGSDTRLRRQLRLLAGLDLDVAALQECTGWDRDYYRVLHLAEGMLGMRGFLAESSHGDCHVGVFVRESPGLRVTGQRHDRQPPLWHALACVTIVTAGCPGPLLLASAHLAPSSPVLRLAEAESLALLPKHGPVVMAGDWNAAPATVAHPVSQTRSPRDRRKLDRRAAQAIEDAGFLDTGTLMGDTTPTVGHLGTGQIAYRCDRIYTTLPPATVTGHQVITMPEPDSDHRPVVATFDLAAIAASA